MMWPCWAGVTLCLFSTSALSQTEPYSQDQGLQQIVDNANIPPPPPSNPYASRRSYTKSQALEQARAMPLPPPESMGTYGAQVSPPNRGSHPSSMHVITPSSPPVYVHTAAKPARKSDKLAKKPEPAPEQVKDDSLSTALLEIISSDKEPVYASDEPAMLPPPEAPAAQAEPKKRSWLARLFGRKESGARVDQAAIPTQQIDDDLRQRPQLEASAAGDIPKSFYSPGIVIQRKAVPVTTIDNNAEAMAELSPAAGGADALIQLPPDAPAAAQPVALPPPPAPNSQPTPELKPLVAPAPAAAAPVPLEDILQKDETKISTANEPPTSTPETSLPPIKAAAPAVTASEEAPDAPAQKAASAPASKKKAKGGAKAAAENAAATAGASEPKPGLSAASKAVLKKIPSQIDTPTDGASENMNVAHTKAMPQDIVTEGSATHETAGVKIEVNKQKLNWDYDLEKAYNALISGYTDTAIDIYRNVLTNDPNNKNALFGLATTYHRAGMVDMARPLYSKLLGLEPNNRDALNNFLVLLADEAPQEALDQLGKLEAKNPDFSPIPAQMAVIYQKLGDEDKASSKMFRAVMLAPENLTYRYNLAIMLDRQKKYDEAGRLYGQIVEAYRRGEVIPGNIQKIQERLTFISSNRS